MSDQKTELMDDVTRLRMSTTSNLARSMIAYLTARLGVAIYPDILLMTVATLDMIAEVPATAQKMGAQLPDEILRCASAATAGAAAIRERLGTQILIVDRPNKIKLV